MAQPGPHRPGAAKEHRPRRLESRLARTDRRARQVFPEPRLSPAVRRARARSPENAWAWGQAAENASTLLLKAIDRGLAGAELRSIYLETAALWLDYSRLLGAARDSLREQGEVDFETAPALAPRTGQYPFALQLLAMGVLLDAQELIPALVEEVLQFDTDRLLDYLGAAALGLTSASEETFHPRPFGQLRAFFEEADGSDAQALAPYLQSQYREFFQLSPRRRRRPAA